MFVLIFSEVCFNNKNDFKKISLRSITNHKFGSWCNSISHSFGCRRSYILISSLSRTSYPGEGEWELAKLTETPPEKWTDTTPPPPPQLSLTEENTIKLWLLVRMKTMFNRFHFYKSTAKKYRKNIWISLQAGAHYASVSG